jgi:DNA end-binding protein Ku
MRSIWKGAISFGLIHIPVRLYSASKDRALKFKLLHKQDLSEIRYARICKADGKEIPWEDIVKGYEYKKGDFVVLTEEDFEKANLKKTSTIEILDFTDQDQIDPMFYDTPYYLEPEKGAAKAYNLLREALQRSKKVAIGNYVLRQHEHLGVIKPHGNVLVLNQLRYHTEIVSSKPLTIPKEGALPKNEVDIALKLIDHLTKPFHPERYTDTYVDELKAVIKKKSKGKKIKIKKQEPTKAPKIHDIMSLLKESLEQHQKKGKKRKAA